MKTKILLPVFLILLLASQGLKAQDEGVTIGKDGNPPHVNAILEIESSDRGVLLPRLTDLQIQAIDIKPGAESLLVYNTDTKQFVYYDGTAWINIGSDGGGTQLSSIQLQNEQLIFEFTDRTESVDLSELGNTTVVNGINNVDPNDQVQGKIVYNSSDSKLYYYTGSAWKEIANIDDLVGSGDGIAQQLVLSGTSLAITGGNAVDLSNLVTTRIGTELPVSGNIEGETFYNITDGNFYVYDGSSWINTNNLTLSEVLNNGADAGGAVISNVGTPVSGSDAATKSYVDSQISSSGGGDMLKTVYDTNDDGNADNAETVNNLTVETAVPAGAVFTDNQDIADVLSNGTNAGGQVITNLGYPINNTDATTKIYVDGQLSSTMLKSTYDPDGDGTIDRAGNAATVNNLAVNTAVPLNATFTDNQDIANVLSQGTDADGQIISNLGDPVEVSDAATKNYVDQQVANAGGGDMTTTIYDPDGDGLINQSQNSQTVNNLTIESAVPADAVFTDDQTLEEVLGEGASAGGTVISNLGTPVGATDAATKQYVDASIASVNGMSQTTYDPDNNGIVNNAETVNNLTVETAVPANADFTDDQQLVGAVLNGTHLYIEIENGNGVTADLSGLEDHLGDDQQLTLNGSILTLENGGVVNLAGFRDNTDSQNLSNVLGNGNDAGANKITNLAEPTLNQDAATKNYVDSNIAAAGGGDMLKTVYDQNNDGDVDDAENAATVNNLTVQTAVPAGAVFTDNQNLSNVLGQGTDAGANKITNLADPTLAQDATTKAYVDGLVGTNTVSADPPAGASTGDTYFDTDDNTYYIYDGASWVPVDTDEQDLSEVLSEGNDAGTNKIINLADPTLDQDAATKIYVDNLVGSNYAGSSPPASPDTGDTYFDTDDDVLYVFDGTSWVATSIDTDDQDATEVNLSAGYVTPGSAGALVAGEAIETSLGKLEKGLENAVAGGGEVNVQSDWNVVDVGSDAFILNKPTITDDQTLSEVLTEGTDAGANKITNLADPTLDQDAATKIYVDGLVGTNTVSATPPATPSTGDTYYDTDDSTYYIYNGTGWVPVDTDTDEQTLSEVLTEGTDAGASKITNLADPTLAQDAATKAYVDGLVGTNTVSADPPAGASTGDTYYDTDDNTYYIYNGTSWIPVDTDEQNLSEVLTEGTDAGASKITNLADPTLAQDAATKAYVDGLIGSTTASADPPASPNQGDTYFDTDDNTLYVWDGTSWIAVGVDDQNLSEVLTQGTDAGANKITNLADPTLAQDATTKAYVDGLIGTNTVSADPPAGASTGDTYYDTDDNTYYIYNGTSWVPVDNDTDDQNLSEVLTQGTDAGASKISNLADPTLAQDAATKAYVDGIVSSGNLTLTNNRILMGDDSNDAQPVQVHGDISTANDGTFTIGDDAITAAKLHPMGASNDQFLKFDGTNWGPFSITGTLTFKGSWDADTNSPALADAGGLNGEYYIVSVAGSQDLGSGNISFNSGDWVIHNGSEWQQINNSSDVNSVFGRTGVITAQEGDYDLDELGDVNAADLTTGNILIADGDSFDSQTMSGDATIANDGTLTIQNGAVAATNLEGLADAQFIVGTDGTAANNAKVTISGDVAIDNTGDAQIQADAVSTTEIAGAAADQVLTTDGSGDPQWEARTNFASSTLTDGQIFVGNGSDVATGVTMSGDVTITNAGVAAIGDDKVTTAKILNGNVTAAKVEGLADAQFIVGTDGTAANNAKVTMSGDVTMTNAGVTAIQNGAVAATNLEGLADAQFIVGTDGTAANNAKVTISGDVAIDNTGDAQIQADAVSTTEIAGAAADQVLTTDGSGDPQWEARTNFATSTLNSANIFVGNGSDVATGVAMSGDVAIDNSGSTTIQQGAVEATAVEGLADGEFIIGVDGTAANNNKATMSGDVTMTNAGVTAIQNGAVAATNLEGLADAQFIVGTDGTAANNAKVTISGDVAIDNTGDAQIQADAVSTTEIAGAAADQVLTTDGSGDPQWEARTNFASSTLTDGQIFVGNGSDVATGVTMSGDVTITNAGVAAIGDDKVTTAKILNGNVTAAKVEGLADAQFIVGTDGTAANNAKVTMSGDVTMTNAGVTAIQNGAVAATNLEGLADAQFIVGTDGTAANNAKVTISGDVAIDNTGDAQIQADAVSTTEIAGAAADQVLTTDGSGDPQWEARTNFASSTLTDGQIFVGNGSDVATGGVTMSSGDVTMTNAGVGSVTIK